MARARFSIGIDLGTTNSALAFAPLVGEATPEILLVPQWVSLAGQVEEPTLPSFLYLPEEAVAAHFGARSIGAGQWIIGRPFREVLALPSLCRPVGAVPSMGIDGSGA
jgi:molecular chaperone DnaK (HSP70)